MNTKLQPEHFKKIRKVKGKKKPSRRGARDSEGGGGCEE